MRFYIAIAAFVAAITASSTSSAFQTPLRLPVASTRSLSPKIGKNAAAPPSWQQPTYHHAKALSPLQMSDAAAAAVEPAGDAGVSGTGTASIPNEIFNLVKSIVGAGVLSLPVGE